MAASSGLPFSKDKAFRPDNDKVLVEIRVAGEEGSDHQWIDYELSGKVAATDNMVPSGIRVVRPVSRQDEENCTRSSEPDPVIAACTRLIESGQFTSRNLAIFHYDRGIAHKNKKDFDQALRDYSEAIRLDPNYAHAYLNRGVLLADKRELDRALPDFDAAIRLDPTDKLGLSEPCRHLQDQRRLGSRHRRLQRGDPARPERYQMHLRPRHRLSLKAGLRPRDRRFRRGHPAGAQGGRGLHAARSLPSGEGRIRAGHRRLYRGDQADAARSRALYRSRLGISLRRRSRPRDRGYTEALGSIRNRRSPINIAAGPTAAKANSTAPLPTTTGRFNSIPRTRPLFARGFTHYLAGSLAKALADVSQANALDPAEPYAALWLGILGQRSRLAGQMAKATGKVDMTAWPAPVIKLFLGE